MKILVITPVEHIQNLWDRLNNLGEIVYIPDPQSINELKERCADPDVIFTNPNKLKIYLGKDFLELFLPLTALNDSKRSEVMMRRMAVMQKRIIMLISASAIERYEHFTKTYSGISQRVPQKMIASYLGITPEALSKVKGTKAVLKDEEASA